jgi:hypothetical protein
MMTYANYAMSSAPCKYATYTQRPIPWKVRTQRITQVSLFSIKITVKITVDTQLPKNTFETSILSILLLFLIICGFLSFWAIRLVELIQDHHSRGALAIVSSYFGSALRRWLSCIPGGHDEQKHGITMNPTESHWIYRKQKLQERKPRNETLWSQSALIETTPTAKNRKD